MRVLSLAPNKIEKLFEMCFFFVKREKEALAFPKKERDKEQFVWNRASASLSPLPRCLSNAKMNLLNRAKRERETGENVKHVIVLII